MMPGLLWTALGGFRGLLAAFLAAAVTWGACALYDRAIDDPAVAASARQDYVQRAELTAAQARLAEVERQRNAGAQTLEEYRKRLAAYQTAAAAEDARHEQEISDYEKKLADLGKSCLVDGDFLDWLHDLGEAPGPGGAKAGAGRGKGQPAGVAGRLPHP